MKRFLFLVLSLTLSLSSLGVHSHDEGHGPKLEEESKAGGIMAGVVDAKDAKKADKADLVYKAELLRSEDGKVRINLYDQHMHPVDLKKFDKKAEAIALSTKKKKASRLPFTLNLEESTFAGMLPKIKSKPFQLEVKFKEGDRELLTNFQNLD